jgi:hypothetical protein
MHGERHTLATTIRARRRPTARTVIAVSAAFAAAPLAVAPAASAAPSHPGRAAATAANEQLNVIRAVSATDIWVLGQNNTTSAPLVWRGNGRTWTQISVPSRLLHGGAALVGITATSADNAWAVGVSGAGGTLILRWNGQAWSRQASPNLPKLTGGLSSVTATSARDAWALGDQCSMTSQACSPLILHWTGASWSKTKNPQVATIEHLDEVTATSPDSAWADGLTCSVQTGCPSGAAMVHWNGKAWSSQMLPAIRGLGLFAVAATSARDPWAFGRTLVGGRTKVTALRWTGSRWTNASPPTRLVPDGALESGALTSPNDVWAVALPLSGGTVLIHWNGKKWSHVPSPTPGVRGSTDLWQVVAISRQNAWAIGSYCAKPNTVACGANRPLLQHWNGKRWTAASI